MALHASLGPSERIDERRAGEFLFADGVTPMPLIPESRILIVATDGFEEWELFGPREILQKRGAEVVLTSLKLDPIQGTVHDDPGRTIRPDLTVDDANADDFDALVLPGGVRNP